MEIGKFVRFSCIVLFVLFLSDRGNTDSVTVDGVKDPGLPSRLLKNYRLNSLSIPPEQLSRALLLQILSERKVNSLLQAVEKIIC